MSDLANAVTLFLSALHDPESDFEAAHERRVDVHQATGGADPEELALAAARIAESLGDGDFQPGPGGVAAITGGALVESGAPTGPLGEAILGRLTPILRESRRLQDACRAKLPPPSDDEEPNDHDHSHDHGEQCEHEATVWMGDREVPLSVAQEVSEGDMAGAMAFESLENWCLPAIACLTRSQELRAFARANEGLYVQARAALGYEGFLVMALDLLDEEPLLVLHPSTQQGYRVRISGVADNFQLHLLLGGALISADETSWGLPGERPTEAALAIARGEGHQEGPPVTGLWNLYTWRAISPDGKLPSEVPQEDWIWNEGRPADIEPFEAEGEPPLRVVVLGPPSYERGWRVNRIFAGLAPSVDVEVLTPDQAEAWIERLAKG
ncbi:MAG: hypothetical protein JKY65_22350 [Planctomycetes bacterium]|nr:hypothetical protein [Planctomycetota bacterium]